MKQTKRRILPLLLCILIVLSLTACGTRPEDRIIGSWASADGKEHMTFYADSTLLLENDSYSQKGIWVIKDGNILEVTIGNGAATRSTIVDITDTTMTLDNEKGVSLTLVKEQP